MPKVWNKRDPNIPRDAIYVGRPSKWGNPFIIGIDGDRKKVLEKFKEYCINSATIKNAKKELKGKDLVCWCSPEPCHADILLKIANEN